MSLLALLPRGVCAQSCQTSNDIETPIRTAITTAAQRVHQIGSDWKVGGLNTLVV